MKKSTDSLDGFRNSSVMNDRNKRYENSGVSSVSQDNLVRQNQNNKNVELVPSSQSVFFQSCTPEDMSAMLGCPLQPTDASPSTEVTSSTSREELGDVSSTPQNQLPLSPFQPTDASPSNNIPEPFLSPLPKRTSYTFDPREPSPQTGPTTTSDNTIPEQWICLWNLSA